MDDFETEYSRVSTVLMEYGGLVAPFIVGCDWRTLQDRCALISANPPTTAADRDRAETDLNDCIANSVFHPNYRAFYVYRSLERRSC